MVYGECLRFSALCVVSGSTEKQCISTSHLEIYWVSPPVIKGIPLAIIDFEAFGSPIRTIVHIRQTN